MSRRSRRLLTLTLLFITLGATQALGQEVIYNNIPGPLPGNLVSQAFEAQSASEFGDRVQFAGTGRKLATVTQVMSSWGCESGHWYSGDCVTTPGATFSHEITLNIYNVGPGASVGTLIGSVTQTFAIPYRPSADNTNCTGGRWLSGTTCYNGFATPITFNLGGLVVPDEVIYSIAYNTTHYGASPIGEGASCYTPAAGCGYDSLNVAVLDPSFTGLPTVGVNPAPDDAYLSSTWTGAYCDSGAGGTGTFRLDPGAGCWTGYKPAVKFNAAKPPQAADDCKKGGWQNLTTETGEPFKNQGQCVSYVKP